MYTPNMPFQWLGPTIEKRAQDREEYKDGGCYYRGFQIAASCLACPLPECKLDNVEWAEAFIPVEARSVTNTGAGRPHFKKREEN